MCRGRLRVSHIHRDPSLSLPHSPPSPDFSSYKRTLLKLSWWGRRGGHLKSESPPHDGIDSDVVPVPSRPTSRVISTNDSLDYSLCERVPCRYPDGQAPTFPISSSPTAVAASGGGGGEGGGGGSALFIIILVIMVSMCAVLLVVLYLLRRRRKRQVELFQHRADLYAQGMSTGSVVSNVTFEDPRQKRRQVLMDFNEMVRVWLCVCVCVWWW
jgi:hypothetical protein